MATSTGTTIIKKRRNNKNLTIGELESPLKPLIQNEQTSNLIILKKNPTITKKIIAK